MLEVEDLSRRYITTKSYSSAEEAVTVLSHFYSVLQRLLQLTPNAGNRRPEFYISECCRYAAALSCFHSFERLLFRSHAYDTYLDLEAQMILDVDSPTQR